MTRQKLTIIGLGIIMMIISFTIYFTQVEIFGSTDLERDLTLFISGEVTSEFDVTRNTVNKGLGRGQELEVELVGLNPDKITTISFVYPIYHLKPLEMYQGDITFRSLVDPNIAISFSTLHELPVQSYDEEKTMYANNIGVGEGYTQIPLIAADYDYDLDFDFETVEDPQAYIVINYTIMNLESTTLRLNEFFVKYEKKDA